MYFVMFIYIPRFLDGKISSADKAADKAVLFGIINKNERRLDETPYQVVDYPRRDFGTVNI